MILFFSSFPSLRSLFIFSAINQRRFTECGGLAVLVPLLSQPIEEELMAAVKYVLQICVPGNKSLLILHITQSKISYCP